jgi:hypothetical protein
MKKETKTKTKNIAIVMLLSLSLLMGGNLQSISAQTSERYANYDLYLSITPSSLEEGSESHPVGYVYFVNKNDVSIKSPVDVDIMLTSDNPSIASVPKKILFSENAEYAKFDISTGVNGKTTKDYYHCDNK